MAIAKGGPDDAGDGGDAAELCAGEIQEVGCSDETSY